MLARLARLNAEVGIKKRTLTQEELMNNIDHAIGWLNSKGGRVEFVNLPADDFCLTISVNGSYVSLFSHLGHFKDFEGNLLKAVNSLREHYENNI